MTPTQTAHWTAACAACGWTATAATYTAAGEACRAHDCPDPDTTVTPAGVDRDDNLGATVEGEHNPRAVVGGEDDLDVVASNVARRRKALGLSQEVLAEAMREAGLGHWRQNTVSRIETGKQELTVRELRALQEILGNVMAGTRTAESAPSAVSAVQDAVLVRRLRRLDQTLTEALEGVRALRSADNLGVTVDLDYDDLRSGIVPIAYSARVAADLLFVDPPPLFAVSANPYEISIVGSVAAEIAEWCARHYLSEVDGWELDGRNWRRWQGVIEGVPVRVDCEVTS